MLLTSFGSPKTNITMVSTVLLRPDSRGLLHLMISRGCNELSPLKDEKGRLPNLIKSIYKILISGARINHFDTEKSSDRY